ncbi:HEPN-associated N-terminal domain-containing protein [Streptomyces sp. NPDC006173]|uniref:HEPN-associated N-terminal domain-containing protein n=1 Tax=Streptomyces sp. NPDC006173 TaxID=3155349 RepID=UPI0033E0C2D6
MGLAKRYMEEVEAQGWYPTEDTWVCEQCVAEPFLANIIKGASSPDHTCNFCDESPAAPLDVFMEAFMQGLTRRYEDADNEHRYDSEAGEYLGNTFESTELIWEYEHIFANHEFLEAVSSSIIEKIWTDNDFWYYTPSEALSSGWERFREAVMYESRYVFWLRKDWQDQDYDADGIHPARVLQALSDYVEKHDLYRTVEAGETFWRARTHTEAEVSWGAKDLGTAGREYAKQANRMSPAGIPMFYGAEDADTAVRESLVRTSDTHVSVASFQAKRRFTVVDLTGSKIPPIPSEFDIERFAERHRILFLRDFIKELTKPIRESYEQIDYVPTQILTEYLLKVHEPSGERSIDGLMYTSAVTGKACVVLDVPNQRCINQDDEIKRFADDELHLKIAAESLSTFKIKREYEPMPPTDPFAQPS